MNDLLSHFKKNVQGNVHMLKEELKTIRTGRANPGMVENLPVEAYGGSMKMKLMELASILTEGTSALLVVPFDPSTTQDIEKAIQASPLGINPQTEGHKMILRIPPLSEEQRIKYVKFVSQLIEDTKNKIRSERDDVRKKLKKLEEEKAITEDELYRCEKEIDQVTTASGEELQSIKSNKEKEIMEV